MAKTTMDTGLLRAPGGSLAYDPSTGRLLYSAITVEDPALPIPSPANVTVWNGHRWYIDALVGHAAMQRNQSPAAAYSTDAEGTRWDRGAWETWSWGGRLMYGRNRSYAPGGTGWTLEDSASTAWGRVAIGTADDRYIISNVPKWAEARIRANYDPQTNPGNYSSLAGWYVETRMWIDPDAGKPYLEFYDSYSQETMQVGWDDLKKGKVITFGAARIAVLDFGKADA